MLLLLPCCSAFGSSFSVSLLPPFFLDIFLSISFSFSRLSLSFRATPLGPVRWPTSPDLLPSRSSLAAASAAAAPSFSCIIFFLGTLRSRWSLPISTRRPGRHQPLEIFPCSFRLLLIFCAAVPSRWSLQAGLVAAINIFFISSCRVCGSFARLHVSRPWPQM
jgi:hypothetical protein